MNSQERILQQPRTTLEAMRAERKRLGEMKRKSRQKMAAVTSHLFQQEKASADRLGTLFNLIQSGMAIYQGMRMGASFISALRSNLGKKAI